MSEFVESNYDERASLWSALPSSNYLEALDKAITAIATALRSGKKILIAGNGGSAADAQHFAAELIGRFQMERRALPALALTVDTSILTSVANDYSFNDVFARQVEALGEAGDIFIGITTSGLSDNITRAVLKARENDMVVIGMCGNKNGGGSLASLTDILLKAPNDRTALVQEIHEFSFHTICDAIEHLLFDTE